MKRITRLAPARCLGMMFVMMLTAMTAWAETENLGGYNFTVETDDEGQYYVIDGTAALDALASFVNGDGSTTGKRFKVTNDITYSHAENEGDVYESNYTAIGGNYTGLPYFEGTFDGQNHVISGIRIYKNGTDGTDSSQGLFGSIRNANIHDINLTDARITGDLNIGGIVGENCNSSVSHTTITASVITARIQYNRYGTICGFSYGGYTYYYQNYYSNCTVNGVANASNVGCYGADIPENDGAVPSDPSATTYKITYDLAGGQLPSGQTNPTTYTAQTATFTLVNPVRDGYEFAGWTGTELNSATQTVTITQGSTGNRSYTATWSEVGTGIAYIDGDGNTHYREDYTVLTGSETTLAAGTWYYLASSIAYDHALTLGNGEVTLILGNGATMNFDLNNGIALNGDNNALSSLTIYGQTLDDSQAGKLVCTNVHTGIDVRKTYTQHSGTVELSGNHGKLLDAGSATVADGSIIVNGGKFKVNYVGTSDYAIHATKSISFNGGKVEVTTTNGSMAAVQCSYLGSGNNNVAGTITLGWSNASDHIQATSYSGTVTIADGKAFHNGSEVLSSGPVSGKALVNGKTLRPCVLLTEGTVNDYSNRTDGLTTWVGQDMTAAFQRTFNVGKASTICLPFPMTSITGGTVYGFVGVTYNNTDGWVATMQEPISTTLAANTPYLFMPSGNSETVNVTFSGSLADVASISAGETQTTTTDGTWTFKGTYSRLEYGTAPFSGKAFGFAATNGEGQDAVKAGEFVRAISGAHIPAFRAFLTYAGTDPDLQARATRGGGAGIPDRIAVRLIGKDGEIDGIGEIRLSTGEVTFDPNAWYDLNGRKLDGKPTQKGIYINNGHKIVIK